MTARTSKRALTTTDAAILGVLSWAPMSGYEVKKTVDSTVGYVWGPARSAIYAVLPRLVEDGLATARKVAQSRRPDKIVYRITSAGRAALKAWIEETPPPPDSARNPLLLKLFFGDLSSPEVLADQIRARRLEAERLREDMDRFEAAADPDDLYTALTREWGREYAAAVIRWARKAEAQLRRS
jgi:PadR family transcriptional regulator, regulatory protein AphA